MSLGSMAELTILITARDEAERVLRGAKDNVLSLGGVAKIAAVGLATIGVTTIGIGAEAAKMSAQYEQDLKDIHTQAGATDVNLGALNKTLREMGPALGTTPDQLAKMLYHIYSAGNLGATATDRQRNAMDQLTATVKLAQIGHSNFEATSNAVIATIAQFPEYLGHAANAAAALNAIVGSGNMRMDDLARAFGTGLPAAGKAAGLTLKDIGAGLATMTDLGIPSEQAATKLRMSFALFAAPSGAAAKALMAVGLSASEANAALKDRSSLEKYGIHMTDLASDLRKPEGLSAALHDLKKHMESSGLTAVEQSAVIFKAFGGGRTATGIQALYENLDKLDSKYPQQAKIAHDFNKDWTDTTDNVNFKFKQMQSAWSTVMLAIGDAERPIVVRVLPALTSLATWAAERIPAAMQKMGDFIQNQVMPVLRKLGDWIQGTGAPLFERLMGVVGTLAGVGFGLLVNVLGFLGKNMWLVEAAAGALVARFVEMKALELATWALGMAHSFQMMAGEEGVGKAVLALGGAGSTNQGLSGALHQFQQEANAMNVTTAPAVAKSVKAIATEVEGVTTKLMPARDALGRFSSSLPQIALGSESAAGGLAKMAPVVEKAGGSIGKVGAMAGLAGIGMSSLATLGIPLLIGGAVALIANWDAVSSSVKGFLDPAWKAQQAVKAVNDQLQAADRENASHVFASMQADTEGFTKALQGAHQSISSGLTTDMDGLRQRSIDLSANIAQLQAPVTMHSKRGGDITFDPIDQNRDKLAAARATKAATDEVLMGLDRMNAGWSKLAAPVQGVINQFRSYKDSTTGAIVGNKDLIKVYDTLGSVQDVLAPKLNEQGVLTGWVSGQNDEMNTKLMTLAHNTSGPFAKAAQQAVDLWQKGGGAVGAQVRAINDALPAFDVLHGIYMKQAEAAGKSGKVAEDWVNTMIGKQNPAALASGKAIDQFAASMNMSHDDVLAYISVTPGALEAFVKTQAHADAVAAATLAVGAAFTAAGLTAQQKATAIESYANGIASGFDPAITQANALNSAIMNIPDHKQISVTVVGGQTAAGPVLKATATGGYFTGPEVRLIGEAGPEWVIPRSNTPAWMRPMLDSVLTGQPVMGAGSPVGPSGGGGGMGGNTTITIPVILDGREIARSVIRHQGPLMRAAGVTQGANS